MKVKWSTGAMVIFFLWSILMTACFFWQYSIPKKQIEVIVKQEMKEEKLCPHFPEPVALQHPLPVVKEALGKIDSLLRSSIHETRLPALSAIIVFNDSVLWNGHFGRTNRSDPASPTPNEYTVYRIASLSKIFPTLMLYKLWEEGKVQSLDDPLEKYLANFSIKNPLGRSQAPLSGRRPLARHPSLTLRRMASQLSGLPRRLRATTLLWQGDTQAALSLLRDDVLVADPGTRCHYSNVAFSLLAYVLSQRILDSDYERWVSENILERVGMKDTGFDITPDVRRKMAVGVYGNGRPAPLYDLGWYRPAGQMFSTAADMARLAVDLLGASARPLLRRDALNTLLTPVLRCGGGYFASSTGTPWEVNQQLGYDVARKDGDLDGYAATFSLVPRLRLGLVVLMAGARPGAEREQDLVSRAYGLLVPAMESAFRAAGRPLNPPPNPAPYAGFFTYKNLTFYEITAGRDGALLMQQFGPQAESSVPERYRSMGLDFLEERVFRVVLEEYPCQLKVNSASVSLEAQDRQLFNFYAFGKKGRSPGFDAPGLNTYGVFRIPRRPIFTG